MPGILEKPVEKYLDSLLPKRDAVLAEMEKYARRRKIPIIGPSCGRLLYLLAQISGAKRMFEMGSAIGYSTIWLARGAGMEAEIYYTDGDPENARRARQNFRRGGVEDRIQLLVGDAIALIDGVPGAFEVGGTVLPEGPQRRQVSHRFGAVQQRQRPAHGLLVVRCRGHPRPRQEQ